MGGKRRVHLFVVKSVVKWISQKMRYNNNGKNKPQYEKNTRKPTGFPGVFIVEHTGAYTNLPAQQEPQLR